MRMEQLITWICLAVLAAALGIFCWQMAELFIATEAMFDALETALEARQ